MKRRYTLVINVIWSLTLLLLIVQPVLAHEGPDDGAEWLMADWMLLSFLVFFGISLLAFLIAIKHGYLSNLEDAKYHVLTINEPDYYTPDWAKEDDNATER